MDVGTVLASHEQRMSGFPHERLRANSHLYRRKRMQNNNFEPEAEGVTEEYSEYERQQQQRTIMIAGGLSVFFAAVAGVLFLLWRRRQPTRLDRAEASLVAAALAAEQAARAVRKRGPSLIERGALSVERAARSTRKQGPALVV